VNTAQRLIDIDPACLVLGEVLGKGQFGAVHKATLNIANTATRAVAVKLLFEVGPLCYKFMHLFLVSLRTIAELGPAL
jgi:hypothetical protein